MTTISPSTPLGRIAKTEWGENGERVILPLRQGWRSALILLIVAAALVAVHSAHLLGTGINTAQVMVFVVPAITFILEVIFTLFG